MTTVRVFRTSTGAFAPGCDDEPDRAPDAALPDAGAPPGPAVDDPSPGFGAANVALATALEWQTTRAWSDADRFEVYLGRDHAAVTEADSGDEVHLGSADEGRYDLEAPLERSATYYWRVDARQHGHVARGTVWSFATVEFDPPSRTAAPAPADGASGVALDVALTWAGGAGAQTYRVYFGDDAELVATAVTGDPEYRGDVDEPSWTPPEALDYDAGYFWRIDAVNADGVANGDVWTFRTVAAPRAQAPTAPSPAAGATEIAGDTVLAWAPRPAPMRTTSTSATTSTSSHRPLGRVRSTSVAPKRLGSSRPMVSSSGAPGFGASTPSMPTASPPARSGASRPSLRPGPTPSTIPFRPTASSGSRSGPISTGPRPTAPPATTSISDAHYPKSPTAASAIPRSAPS